MSAFIDDDNIIVTGTFSDTLFIDNDTLISGSLKDLYYVKLDNSANIKWIKHITGKGNSGESSIMKCKKISGSKDGYSFGGFFYDTLYIGKDTIISKGICDIILFKTDTSGNIDWVRQAGSSNYDKCNSITSDQQGNVNLTGYISNSATFDSTENAESAVLESNGSFDIVIAKYNQNGILQWFQSEGGTGQDISYDIISNDTLITITGYTIGVSIWGSDTINTLASTDSDPIIAKLNNSSGKIIEAITIPANLEEDRGINISQDAFGNLLIFGEYDSDSIIFGDILLTNDDPSRPDGFLVNYGCPITTMTTNHKSQACDTIKMPIYLNISKELSISLMEIIISGYSNKAEFLEISTDSTLSQEANWTFTLNETDSSLIMAAAGAIDITESGILFYLNYCIPFGSTDTVQINLSNVLFNEFTTPVSIINGSIIINETTVDTGDVSLNGEVTAYDASLVLKQLVDLTNLNCSQLANADYTSDYTISSLDAYYILMEASGIETTFEDTDSAISTSISNIESLTLSEGEEYEVLITMPQEILTQSFYQKITYDNTLLELTNINWDILTDNYSIISNSNNGTIKIARASKKSDMEQTGITASLSFSVIDENTFTSTQVILEKVQINEDYISLNPGYVTLSSSSTSDLNTSIETQELSINNYPNPFNESSTIDVFIPESQQIRISIFDINGRIVNTLIDEELSSGMHSFNWNTYDNNGDQLSAGCYFIKVFTMDKVVTNKELKI